MTYGYTEFNFITPEQILQKISQEDIFEYILGFKPELGRQYFSPFRTDKHAGCRFELQNDILLFVDFGEIQDKTHRGFISAAMDMFGITYNVAIDAICNKFGLSTSQTDYAPIAPRIIDKPTNDVIGITYEKAIYDKRDKIFWSKALIKSNELEEDNVFATHRATIIRERTKKTFSIYGLGYAMDFLDAVKIYQPNSSTHKWITNCNEDHIGNFDNLPSTGDTLIIEKAYKDHRLFRNLQLDWLDYHVIWLHNEGCIPSLYLLENLLARFKRVIIFFDNDEKGIYAAKNLRMILNGIRPGSTVMRYVPLRYSPIKDLAEYVGKEGRKDTIKLLKQIRI